MSDHGKYPPLNSDIYKYNGECLFEAIPPVVDRALTGDEKDEILERVFSGFENDHKRKISDFLVENKGNPDDRLSDLKFEFRTTLNETTSVDIPQFFPISSNVDGAIKSKFEKMSRLSIILQFVQPISFFLFVCLFVFLLPHMLQGSMDTAVTIKSTYFTIANALGAQAGTTKIMLPETWAPIGKLLFSLFLILLAAIFVLMLFLVAARIFYTDLPHTEEKVQKLTEEWKETSSNISMQKMAQNGQIAQFVYESKRLMSLRRFFARRSNWLPRFAYPIIGITAIFVSAFGFGVLYLLGWEIGWHIAWFVTILLSVLWSVLAVRWWCDKIQIIRWKYTTNIDPSPTLTYAFFSAIDYIYKNQRTD